MNDRMKYLTEREVSEITGLSVSTLRMHRFKRTGIPYIKIGRSVRYNPDSVHEYMKSCEIIPGIIGG